MDAQDDQMCLVEVNEDNFTQEVLHSRRPTLVAFWASWSRPCQILKGVLRDVASRCTGKVRVLGVNVDDNPDLGVWYAIESIPTLLCFVEGQVETRIVGTASTEAILAKLRPFTPDI